MQSYASKKHNYVTGNVQSKNHKVNVSLCYRLGQCWAGLGNIKWEKMRKSFRKCICAISHESDARNCKQTLLWEEVFDKHYAKRKKCWIAAKCGFRLGKKVLKVSEDTATGEDQHKLGCSFDTQPALSKTALGPSLLLAVVFIGNWAVFFFFFASAWEE